MVGERDLTRNRLLPLILPPRDDFVFILRVLECVVPLAQVDGCDKKSK